MSVEAEGRALTFDQVAEAWRRDPAFRSYFIALLAAVPYQSFFWETPPVTRGTLGRRFEFIVADAPALLRPRPDPAAFAEHFADCPSGIACFENLGGDALLVAPAPRGSDAVYPHLAAFARGASEDQQQALWRAVGEALAARVGERPLWLSTSGLGIAWLHLRLDRRPKYYSFAAYRDER